MAWGDDARKRPTDEQRGKELYERHCLACHGATGAGDGPATAALVVKIPNLIGKVKSDKAAVDLVVFGKGAMPAFEASFDAEDARRVLKYMATADKPAPAPKGEAPKPEEAGDDEGDGGPG